jgi:copper chaperone
MTPPTTSADQRTYRVDGMTCDHCVLSVREEVGELAGVTAIDIDLASGRLTVTGAGLDDGAIAAAVADAGYQAVTA